MFPQPGGGYLVVWDRDDSGSVMAREYDAAGEATGPAFPFTPSAFDADDVARDGAARFVVVRSANDAHSVGVFGRRYDATAMSLGAEFQVNTNTGGAQRYSAVATDAAGNFLVVWEDAPSNDIFAQRFDAAGLPAGSEFMVNGSTTDDAENLDVAADGAGNFVVVWNADFAFADVLARRFDATGTPLGPPFTVGSTGYDPSVVPDGAGGFMVLWSGSSVSDNDGVLARRYDGAGAPLGPDFQLNTYTTGPQRLPTATYGATGEFIVMWSGSGAGAGDNILARRYDSAGIPLGPEFQVNTYTATTPSPASLESGPRALIHPDGEFTVTWTSRLGIRAQRFDATGAPVPGDVLISGKRLSMTDPTNPANRTISFASTDPEAVNGLNPLVRPDEDGAFLHLYNPATGDTTCLPLPAGGWVHVGTLDDPFTYKDPQQQNGPCRSARLTRGGRISARCRGAGIAYTLDEPTQGSVVVSLNLGPARYCTVFDGASVRRDSGTDGRFVARNAPVPVACPAPPVSCP